jgi:hypothetical protein
MNNLYADAQQVNLVEQLKTQLARLRTHYHFTATD